MNNERTGLLQLNYVMSWYYRDNLGVRANQKLRLLEEMGARIVQLTNDGRAYVVKSLGLTEREDTFTQSLRLELRYLLVLANGADAEIGEYVAATGVPLAPGTIDHVRYDGKEFARAEPFFTRHSAAALWQRVA